MERESLARLLEDCKKNKVSINDAVSKLKDLPYEDLGFAKLDHHRSIRRGFPEAIFCQGKTGGQIIGILRRISKKDSPIILTRLQESTYNKLKRINPKLVYSKSARIAYANARKQKSGKKILVITAGTSDIPVAEEAAITAELMGHKVERLFDVGVAGIHRLLKNRKKIDEANVLIIVAGMEGALPSVVSGLTDKPIIAVPTSIGYGASFKGIAPLLAMLNSCSPGVAVMNIDNGFGAGYFAGMINK